MGKKSSRSGDDSRGSSLSSLTKASHERQAKILAIASLSKCLIAHNVDIKEQESTMIGALLTIPSPVTSHNVI